MTAIITVLCDNSVYHVSDRLVSVPDLQRNRVTRKFLPYDSTANKSIIYVGQDCRLVLGYTGPSHIGEVTTDRWLAELVRGGMAMPEQSEHRWPPVGDLRCEELLELMANGIPDGLTISVGGYQETSYGDLPRLWTVYRNLIERSHEETSATVIPRDAATVVTYREIEDEINGAPAHIYAGALVRAMRKISSRNTLVGSDYIVVRVLQAQRRFEMGVHLADSNERSYSAGGGGGW